MTSDVMATALGIVAGLICGLVTGALFFGGLWWTVQRLTASPHPALLAMASLLVRLALLVVGLWATSQLGLSAMLAAGVGLLVARQLIVRQVRSGITEAS